MITKMNKAELLSILATNKLAHVEEFEKAWKGYQSAIIRELELRLEAARKGKVVDHYLRATQPINQTREYNRAIKMVQFCVEDSIELNTVDFTCFVMDEWEWTNQFKSSTRPYIEGESN